MARPLRRAVLLGAAWSIPAIGITRATPARAASAVHTLAVVVPEPTERPTGADLGDVVLRLTRDGEPLADAVLAVVDGSGPAFEDGSTVRALHTDGSGTARCTGLGAGAVTGEFAVLGEHPRSGATGRAVFRVVEPPRARPFVLRDDTTGDHLGLDADGVVAARGTLAVARAAAASFRFPFGSGPVAESVGPIEDDAGRRLTGVLGTPWAGPSIVVRATDSTAGQRWHVGADGSAAITAPDGPAWFLADAGDDWPTLVLAGGPGVLRIVTVD